MGWIDGLIYGLVLVIIYILVGAYLIDPQPIRRGHHYEKQH